MEVSLPTNELPDGVAQEELYDGPKIVQHPASAAQRAAGAMAVQLTAPIPPPEPEPQVSYQPAMKKDYPATVLLALDVLSARLLGLVALVTACLIWAGVVWDPNLWRIVAAGVFSLTVFLPIMVIYWKAGMTGEGG